MSEININIIDNKRIGVDVQSGVNGQTVAANVNIADTGSLYTATTVEGALAEAMTTVNTKANQSTTFTKAEVNTALDLKANKVQEAWITPTLLNGWTGGVRYAKNSLGLVTIQFNTAVAGTTTYLTSIFTIPLGYRPSISAGFFLRDATSTGVLSVGIEISNTGAVRILNGSASGRTNQGQITFYAD